MLAAFKRVQYYEIKAYSGHFYTPKSGKAAFCGTTSGPRVLEKRDFASSPDTIFERYAYFCAVSVKKPSCRAVSALHRGGALLHFQASTPYII